MFGFFNASSWMDTPEEQYRECLQTEPTRTAGVFPIKISPCSVYKVVDQIEYTGLQVILNLTAIASAAATLGLAAWVAYHRLNKENTAQQQAAPSAPSLSGT